MNRQIATGGTAEIAARLDRLPSSPYLWKLVMLLAAGAFFEIYDLLMTGYVSPGIIRAGIFSETAGVFLGMNDQATFASVTFAGLLVGTLAFGSVADRYGRRTVFTYALLWYAAATAVMAAQSTAEGIFLARFAAGLGLGVEMVTIDTFLAELVPQKFRGRAFAATHGLMFLSVPLVAFLSWAMLGNAPLGIAGWRWVVAFPVVGAVLVWYIRRDLPESPRWLAEQGRHTEAASVVDRIEARIEAETGTPLPAFDVISANERPATGSGSLADVMKPPFRRRALMMAVFNFFQTIGFFGFGNWVPKLVSGQGVNIADSLLYSAVIALAFPLGPFLFVTFADRFERKWQIVCAAVLTALFGLLFTQQFAAWSIILLGVAITFSNNLMSYSYHTYQAEIFPTRIRSRAIGFAYSFSRLSTIFTSFLIALFAREFSNIGVFVFIGGSMIVAAGSIAMFGPQTRGRSLEEISGR